MFSLTNSQLKQTQETRENILSKEKYTILYFYPKDNTPGCTTEAKDFSEISKILSLKSIQIIGVSRDDHTSHCNFISTHELTPSYMSDPELILHKKYHARGEKNNYGKIVTGVIRSTILLDNIGSIIQERHNVKATGHAQRILKWIEKNMN